jgi:predicted aspartyl protease
MAVALQTLFWAFLAVATPQAAVQKERFEGQIKLSLSRDHILLARVRIGDIDNLTFLVDTGSSCGVVSDALADRLGVKPKLAAELSPRLANLGFPFTKEAQAVLIRDMLIYPDVPVINEVPYMVMSAESLRGLTGRPVDGILGMNSFMSVIALFDFKAKRIKVWYPAVLSEAEVMAEGMAGALELPAEYIGTTVSVRVGLGNGQVVSLVVDTGANTSGISPAMAKEAGAIPSGERKARTAGGEVTMLETRIPSLTIGPLELQNVTVYYPKAESAGVRPHIGMDVWSKGKLLFDAPHSRLLYKPY